MPENQIFGYADHLHVSNRQTVAFSVSSEGDEKFDASLVRIVNGCVDSDKNTYREIEIPCEFEGEYQGRAKKIYTGSYASVDLEDCFEQSSTHTVQLCFQPSDLRDKTRQTILHLQGSDDNSISIEIEGTGIHAYLEGKTERTDLGLKDQLIEKHWYLLALSWSSSESIATLQLWRYDHRCHQLPRFVHFEQSAPSVAVHLGQATTLTLAAQVTGIDENDQKIVSNCFDGKIDALRIANKALTQDEVFIASAFYPADDIKDNLPVVVNFSAKSSCSFKNEVDPDCQGMFFNLPLLGVTGSRWDGTSHNFAEAPDHYSAIRFHSDDVYDCDWGIDFSFTVPENLKSGIYAAKLVNQSNQEDYVPFFVSPPKTAKKRAPIALMLPTMTYLAYGNNRIDENSEQYRFDVGKWADQVEPCPDSSDKIKAHPEFGSSLYDYHPGGLGCHFSSWLRPIMTMRPKAVAWGLVADTLIVSWLEHCGLDFDIITDHMVHEEGVDLLSRYATVISGNHPEYVTSDILDAISAYTNECGGRFIYMGANGYYWVTGVDSDFPAAVEIRRGVAGSGAWFSQPGEYYLQSTGQLGGLWRHVGRPPQEIFGVGTRGMGFPGSIGFTRSSDWNNPRVRFLTEGVTEDALGEYGILGNGAAGEEIDAIDDELGTPKHALVIASSHNHPRGMMIAREDLKFVVPDEWVESHVRADITFFETTSGGAVLSLSSMSWCGSLSHNNYTNGICRLSENAVRRFIDPKPFKMPEVSL